MADAPRVRFAPSPTGYLHVGGARTALFNWLFARHQGGAFILRIEDTDRQRSQPELTEAIIAGLEWLGLDWDEGPLHQADGIERHRVDAERLLESGAAYRCFCTPEELETMRAAAKEEGRAAAYDGRCREIPPEGAARRAASGEPHAVRFRMPLGLTEWDDLVQGVTRFQNRDIEDFVILRSDRTPTYNLAVVSDDLEMRISHVVRGADHISNTPKQIQIYRALGAELPAFCHVPLIMGPDGKRLSKRHGATAVGEYREAGFVPAGMRNFLALLGWSPGDDTEYMEPAELVTRFSLERINKKPAVFDLEKLEWLNGQHIANTPDPKLAEWIAPKLIDSGLSDEIEWKDRQDWFESVLHLVKTRARTLNELYDRVRPFFVPAVEYDPAAVKKHWKDPTGAAERLDRLRDELEGLEAWNEEALEAQLRALAEVMGIGAGKLIHPLRVALTGSAVSPGIFEVMNLLGRDVVLRRIDAAIDHLRGS
ncbi:MAG: glutamate--tRNA ligase [Gemmatimonadetes bacterium]|uniref:Glutamate--tRNA ligase n=1 Tax=Candidatus Kutchimonas denitrificans TaxID=3056748 RepID=A0AAE5CCI8_9BACT|nr:glutamate--tRNA ligase [Gemmatimonadota bacterium]NIR75993.1 glutamate--tRNA ligase [Candidatus Kutchimonas denitrificans]NIS02185.1 glutamate--tRNA ligase [Gemmatimonadota bacterium]NIT68011.1 glutamate--tRNA ligase [Gemmatimonadota bacterium]NIU54037.1 glutamate--tRNA ligase [Gemmatimonadota bacterium]